MKDPEIDPNLKNWLNELVAKTTPETIVPNHVADNLNNTVSFSKRVSAEGSAVAKRTAREWKALGGGEQAMVGMGLIAAALSTIGAISNAKNAFAKDERGERQFKPSLVGLALLDAAFAAGAAFLSVSTLRGRA